MRPRVYKTVSAGDPNKYFSSTIKLDTNIYDYNLISEDEDINPRKYDIYVVIGDSMSNSRINDRDVVLVERLNDKDKRTIKPDNVLLLETDKSKESGQSDSVEFKLRKHIAYISNEDSFDAWIDRMSEKNKDIPAKQEQIRAKYEKCIEKHRQNNPDNENFIFTFSSTLDELSNEVKYSFHPIKFLNGMVCYAVKNKDILE
ncbi:MAG: hypothetical protein LBF59_00705 [Prevotellaceae bacterium]|nr:hypothetical protein [Prevotellaceae bacterium]